MRMLRKSQSNKITNNNNHMNKRISESQRDSPLGMRRLITYAAVLAFSLHMPEMARGSCISEIGEQYAIGENISYSCDFREVMQTQNCSRDQIHIIIGDGNRNATSEMLETVGDTKLNLVIRNATAQRLRVLCKCGDLGVSETCIRVDTKPMLVTAANFTCESHDFKYMECEFPNVERFVMHQYTLAYNSYEAHNVPVPCDKAEHSVICNVSGNAYVPTDEHFNFSLTISNHFGAVHQQFHINNLESVVPARPGRDFKILNQTSHSVCFNWTFSNLPLYVAKRLVWQVNVTYGPISKEWQLEKDSWAYCLRGLPYAGYAYRIHLRLRIDVANSKWSDTFHHNIQTAVDYPVRPPPVISGGYYLRPSEESFNIFWEGLPRHQQNGWTFSYVITDYLINGQRMNKAEIQIEGCSATVNNWQWNATYEFELRSHNEMNDSVEASHLLIRSAVSSKQQRALMPHDVQFVHYPMNKSFELSWKAPAEEAAVQNYTVFWCQPTELTRLDKCKGALDYIHVPKTVRSYIAKPRRNEELIMAVSANYQYYSSGMNWPTCVGNINDKFNGKSIFSYDISNTTFDLRMPAICKATVIGYNLTYCQKGKTALLLPDCQTRKINGFTDSFTVTGLKPFTIYTIIVTVLTKSGNGDKLKSLTVTTGEGVPLPPRQLQYKQKTNTSVTLSWLPPIELNGDLKSYRISVRGDGTFTRNFTIGADNNSTAVEYTVPGLKAFTVYDVSVEACTQYTSAPSNVLSVRTDVGVPSQPILGNPDIHSKFTILNWNKPMEPAGNLEFYEVNITEYDDKGQYVRSQLSYVMGQQPLACQHEVWDCKSSYRFDYSVSAVNVEKLAEQQNVQEEEEAQPTGDFAHEIAELLCKTAEPMSFEQQNQLLGFLHNPNMYRLHKSDPCVKPLQCSYALSSEYLPLIVIIITVLVLFLGNRLWEKYKTKSEIKCLLPEGLQQGYYVNGELGKGLAVLPSAVKSHIPAARHMHLPSYGEASQLTVLEKTNKDTDFNTPNENAWPIQRQFNEQNGHVHHHAVEATFKRCAADKGRCARWH